MRNPFGAFLPKIKIQSYSLELAQWRGADLRIALVTDLHAAEPVMGVRQFDRILALTDEQNPDLIILGGDYVSNRSLGMRPVPLDVVAAFHTRFSAPLGVYAVLGNHDWFDDPAAQKDRKKRTIVWEALEKAGIRVLENESVAIQGQGHDFWLAGLGSQLAYIESMTRRSGRHDMAKTLADITDDRPAILMAHEPNIFPDIPERFALTLSGHTHGGQIRIAGRSLTGTKTFGTGVDYGHYQKDGKHLIVSGGLGYSVAPVRVNNPPEITIVDIKEK